MDIFLRSTTHSPEVRVRLEVSYECRLVDDGPPSSIHKDAVGLHQVQALLVHQVCRVRVQIAVQAHHLCRERQRFS